MNSRARLLAGLTLMLLGIGGARADLDQIKQAAERGDASAQLELGILFQYGFNLKDNEIPALTWYTLSASQGNARAAKLRDALIGKMASKDIEEAMEQVKSYKPPAPVAPRATAEPAPETAAPAPAPAPAPTEAVPADAAAPESPAPPPAP
jgi:hypothetical protein